MIVVINASYLTLIASCWQLSNFIGRNAALQCLDHILELLKQSQPLIVCRRSKTNLLVGYLLGSNGILLMLYAIAYIFSRNWFGLVSAIFYIFESGSICVSTMYITYLVTLLAKMFDNLGTQFKLGGMKDRHSAEFFRLIKLNDGLTNAMKKITLAHGGTVMYLLNGTLMFVGVNAYYLFCVCYYSNEFGGTSQIIVMAGLIIWMANLIICSFSICNACHACSKKVVSPES